MTAKLIFAFLLFSRVNCLVESCDVVVVGAGLAGIGAADLLVHSGCKVIVLEARPMVGGRTQSFHWTPTWLVGLEHGAGFVHGIAGNPLAKLARRLGLSIKEVGGCMGCIGGNETHRGGWESMVMVDDSGTLDPTAKKASFRLASDFVVSLEELAQNRAYRKLGDVTMQQAIDMMLDRGKRRGNQPIPFSSYERMLIMWHMRLLLTNEGSSPDTVSLFNFFFDNHQTFEGPDGVIAEGYSALIETMIKRGKIDVRTSCPVTSVNIEQSPSVQASCGNFTAKSVVMAIPLGVLRSGTPKFTPALPENRKVAMNNVYQATLNRLFIQFEEPFWPAEYAFSLSTPKTKFDFFTNVFNSVTEKHKHIWSNTSVPAGTGVLEAFVGGSQGQLLPTVTTDILQNEVHVATSLLFGRHAHPIGSFRTNWNGDKWSLGAFTTLGLASSLQDLDLLALPLHEGRLLFAGEYANSKMYGTTHGAYESGRTAARLALRAFNRSWQEDDAAPMMSRGTPWWRQHLHRLKTNGANSVGRPSEQITSEDVEII